MVPGMNVLRSVGLFIAAGLAEIGGGYLVWRWLREGSPWPVGLAGAVILVVYGVIPTLQSSADFGRVYAAYGGVFVIMSLLWAGGSTGIAPITTTGSGQPSSRSAWPSSISVLTRAPDLDAVRSAGPGHVCLVDRKSAATRG
jgi:small multidrug resistance family-3 protein